MFYQHIVVPVDGSPFAEFALPYALVATVTGEILAARRGLGFLLNQSATQFDVTGVYAVLLILMVLGFGLSEAMKRIESWLLRWRE